MSKTIVREGYHRKGYYRKGYVTEAGVKIPKTYVSATDVPKARIPARGKAAVTGHKGKKLIDMTDYRHLHDYGYSLKSDAEHRHSALRKAAATEGFLWPIHRLTAVSTLLRNTEPQLSGRAQNDRKYVQNMYVKYKAVHGREHRKTATGGKRK